MPRRPPAHGGNGEWWQPRGLEEGTKNRWVHAKPWPATLIAANRGYCIHYTSRCLESADAADRELGDALPDLKTFLPPRPAPKEQTPKEGDKAAK